ncbi:MAG: hypothetical protein K9H64_17325 [Bacteroidales bacterium]|nr:hypothetical protein [Bacteroidales bacterium]MCF8457722.1 hypothetical protein [Bacteroidales bacterium]
MKKNIFFSIILLIFASSAIAQDGYISVLSGSESSYSVTVTGAVQTTTFPPTSTPFTLTQTIAPGQVWSWSVPHGRNDIVIVTNISAETTVGDWEESNLPIQDPNYHSYKHDQGTPQKYTFWNWISGNYYSIYSSSN